MDAAIGGSGRRRRVGAGLLAIALVSLPVVVDRSVVQAIGHTFVVNSTADNGDASTADAKCSIVGSSTTCTLRAALEQANATDGHDRIEFDIAGSGPHRITPAQPLPWLLDMDGVTIDGYTQPHSSVNTLANGSNADLRIELRGRGPSDIDGLHIRSPGNVLQGLAIFDFKRNVRFWGDDAHDNQVLGNFIGTDADGVFGQPIRVINSNGIHLERGASDNLIGKPGRAHRNVLSGNGDKGIAIYNNGTDRNLIRNNVIGLSPSGARLLNWGHGIDINYDASDNLIGGTASDEANVISGNELSGIEISHNHSAASTTGNEVVGNWIGTDLSGTLGNVATSNREFGVNLEGKPTCPTVASCSPDISNNLVEGNTIVGSDAGVMIWKGAHDNVVRNNRIGVLPNGTIAPSSTQTIWGVLIEAGAFDNLIDSNVIAGVRDGIQVKPTNNYTNEPTNPDIPTTGNTFRRNSIWGITNGYGIDIAPIGAVNDTPGELDPNVQGGVRRPDIVAANEDAVRVTGCGGCLVELFVTDAGIASAYGQGRTFVADASIRANGTVDVVFRRASADPLVIRTGDRLSATVTDAAGNTSEFALRVTVAASVIGTTNPPSTTSPPTGTVPPSGAAGGALAVARRCSPTC